MGHVLPKEWNDKGRPSKAKTACRSASTTVVNHCSHVLEKPLVRAVVDENHMLVAVLRCPQFAPAPGDYDSCSDRFRGRENHLGQLFWVIDDDTPEPNVDGSWPLVKKLRKLRRRSILWLFAEKEPADI